jgi:squalene synthase HpnC
VVTDAAYARCLQLARAHYENFPVASRLLPGRARPHIAAVYAFARIADDFADEGTRAPEARLALLDDWRQRLDRAVAGRCDDDSSDAAAIFTALADTMLRFNLGSKLFEDLLSAFRQDVQVGRYETWADLLDYCRRSANPVGRIVLRICRQGDESADQLSDSVCTALQLVNFWQDLEIDLRKGRLYVPLETVRRSGADIDDLKRGRFTAEWTSALQEAGERTRECFDRGRPIADLVHGRLRWELRATWLGGMRILNRLQARRFNVFDRRPTLGVRDAAVIAIGTLAWRRSRP